MKKTSSYRTKTEGALKVWQNFIPTNKIYISATPSILIIVTVLPLLFKKMKNSILKCI